MYVCSSLSLCHPIFLLFLFLFCFLPSSSSSLFLSLARSLLLIFRLLPLVISFSLFLSVSSPIYPPINIFLFLTFFLPLFCSLALFFFFLRFLLFFFLSLSLPHTVCLDCKSLETTSGRANGNSRRVYF